MFDWLNEKLTECGFKACERYFSHYLFNKCDATKNLQVNSNAKCVLFECEKTYNLWVESYTYYIIISSK